MSEYRSNPICAVVIVVMTLLLAFLRQTISDFVCCYSHAHVLTPELANSVFSDDAIVIMDTAK